MTRILIVLLVEVLCVPALFSQSSTTQTPTNPCAAPEQKELDFWVGDWELTWPGQNPGTVERGTNRVQRVLDGCVVEENFSGENSTPLRGTSVSTFDGNSKKWKQTWVDNQGAYLDFVGEFRDGQMILQREALTKNGRVLQRMVWKNIRPADFDWSWEASKDGGKTWQVQWAIHYKRKS